MSVFRTYALGENPVGHLSLDNGNLFRHVPSGVIKASDHHAYIQTVH